MVSSFALLFRWLDISRECANWEVLGNSPSPCFNWMEEARGRLGQAVQSQHSGGFPWRKKGSALSRFRVISRRCLRTLQGSSAKRERLETDLCLVTTKHGRKWERRGRCNSALYRSEWSVVSLVLESWLKGCIDENTVMAHSYSNILFASWRCPHKKSASAW